MLYKLYKKLPYVLQNLACTMYGLKEYYYRYGKFFKKWQQNLRYTEFYTSNEIIKYQEDRLKELIKNAYENVPYYTEIFNDRGLTPDDIKTIEDLKKLPILTKEIINDNRDKFVNLKYKKGLYKKNTSGTTGSSLQFYSTKEALSFQWAIWWRHRSRFGFEFGDKHLSFTGKPVVPLEQIKPPFWRWNKIFNQAIIGMQSINNDSVNKIAEFIDNEKFNFWVGYPSIIHEFCTLLQENEIELNYKPKVIFLGAENVYANQKQTIELVTNSVITDQYGFTEGAGNASQCEEMNHHEDFEFGILECLNPEFLEDNLYRGEIISTGFSNKAFPFIRYKVGDVGIWSTNNCVCGRMSKVLKSIEGRVEDYVVAPEGGRFMRFDYLFKDTDTIKEAQVLQVEKDLLVIRVVQKSGYSKKVEEEIEKNIKKYISTGFRVSFEYLDQIPRENNGKFRAVKSMMNNNLK